MTALRVLTLVAAAALAGCGSPPAPRAEVPVSGHVVETGGKPVAGKVVCFHPQEPDQRDNASGTDDKGHFTLKLVPGLYHVTLAEPGRGATGGADNGGVIAPEKGAKPKIGGMSSVYRNANETPWKVTIPAAGQSDLKLNLIR